MSVAWKNTPLCELSVLFTDGDWIESKDQSEDGIRLIQTGNVGIGDFKDRAEKARYISPDTFQRLRCQEIFEGDCLISRLPDPVGRSCIIPSLSERAITAVDCTIVRFDTTRIIPEFFNYYSRCNQYFRDVEFMCGGATRKRISRKNLSDITVPVPSIAEQKRIVAILDEAFAGIAAATANAEKNLANARELFDVSLEAIFTNEGAGWVQRQFSEICEITSKLVDPREPSFIDLPHLGAGNMVSKTGELIEIKTAREEELKSGKFLFDKNMVMYSKIRPYLMKACRPDFGGLCSADVYPLLPKPSLLDRNFLFYMLLSRKFTEFAIAGSDRAGMPKVNRDHLFSYIAWLPDFEEQRLLASKLDEISSEIKRIELIYQRKISALAELKQAILQKAFSGELTGANPRHCEAA